MQVGLSRLKETAVRKVDAAAAAAGSARVYYYPFALALRLRVLQVSGNQYIWRPFNVNFSCSVVTHVSILGLIWSFQIVFGIIFLIVGSVAFIEEKGGSNLGLGIPTGVATIVAAGKPEHNSPQEPTLGVGDADFQYYDLIKNIYKNKNFGK